MAFTDPITVCGLVPYPLGSAPSQRFRVEQWLPDLEAAGVHVDLVPFADDHLSRLLREPGRPLAKTWRGLGAVGRRLWRCLGVRRYDAVLVHRAACIMGPALVERVVRLLGRPIIFDFDDAIYLLHTSAANSRWGWLKFPGKTAALCRLSSRVVVGNHFLAEYAGRFSPHVAVVPSSVDTTLFVPRRRPSPSGKVVIGWSGSTTSQTYLDEFVPLLRRLAALPGVELRVHSDRRPDWEGIPVVWRPWAAATEADELAAFDIGIMPMPDTVWAKGKCAMKALLYMAMGVPAVCSAVGTNCEVIRHGENGLLATTTEEWLDVLTALARNPELRARLGDAGRRTVEEEYSMRACAARFAEVVRDAVGASRRGSAGLNGVRRDNRIGSAEARGD
jgi:glycosyltransferase involved in cell wall biosynthesis